MPVGLEGDLDNLGFRPVAGYLKSKRPRVELYYWMQCINSDLALFYRNTYG